MNKANRASQPVIYTDVVTLRRWKNGTNTVFVKLAFVIARSWRYMHALGFVISQNQVESELIIRSRTCVIVCIFVFALFFILILKDSMTTLMLLCKTAQVESLISMSLDFYFFICVSRCVFAR